MGLKGLTRTGSNLKGIAKKNRGLFGKRSSDAAVRLKQFEDVKNTTNFLAATLDNTFANFDTLVQQQKKLVEPLANMITNEYSDLIDVLESYGKKHEKHAKLRRQYQRKKGGDDVEVVAAAKDLHSARVNLALRIGKYSQQQHISHLQLLNRLALLNEQYIRCTYEHFVEKNASNYIRKIFLSIEAANEKLTDSVTTAGTLFRESILTKEEMAEEQSTYRKTPSGIVGYLNKRSKTWKNKWMRRWFHVEGKSFFYTKGENQHDRLQEFDLTLASIRPARNVSRDFCFELVSSAPGGGMRIMVLQASNKIEYDAWMQAVMDAIMGALDHVTPAGEIDATANMKNSKRHLKARERQIETLSSAPGNLCCCECNTTKDVEWLSLNLGVIFCLDCAGIHRSLGVHVSQCRSFKLDVLDDSILSCFASMGNEMANAVWEGNTMASGLSKPTPASPRPEKELWIRAKYVDKKFLPSAADKNLVDAATADDMQSVLLCVARGDDLNEINEWGATALGAAAHLGKLNPMTFLLLNGCDVNTCSPESKWTPLHAAAYGGIVDAVRILVAKGADVDAKEKHGDSPLDIAYKYKNFDCVEVMGGLLSGDNGQTNHHSSEATDDMDQGGQVTSDAKQRIRSRTVNHGNGDNHGHDDQRKLPPKPVRRLPPPQPIRRSVVKKSINNVGPPAPQRRPSWRAAAENSARRRSTRHTVSS